MAPGDIFWPIDMRFSPDDRKLVCVYHLQIYIVDIATGVQSLLIHDKDGVMMPDWSPDGTRVVYRSRSGVLRCFDFMTREDRAIRPDSRVTTDSVYIGKNPLWSRDGTRIAFIQIKTVGNNIALINADGSGYRALAETEPGELYSWLHWYYRPARDLVGLMFYQINHPTAGPRFVSQSGSPVNRFHYTLFPLSSQQSFAPDGERVVTVGTDPVDSVSVLFVQRVDDITGSSRRQLTFWDPPATIDSGEDE